MSAAAIIAAQTIEDPVSNLLRWILLDVAVVLFALLDWITSLTYQGRLLFRSALSAGQSRW
jgi:hypothetical protein